MNVGWWSKLLLLTQYTMYFMYVLCLDCMESLECWNHKKVCGNHGVESSQYDDLFCLNWAKDVYQDGTYPCIIAGNSVDQQLYRLGSFFFFLLSFLQLACTGT